MNKPAIAAVAAGVIAMLSLSQAQAQDQRRAAAAPAPVNVGMLDPANMAKPRPKPPFDLTGVWQLNQRLSENSFHDQPGNPTPATQKLLAEAAESAKRNEAFQDDTGACWPTGLPRIMTRVWPVQMIQVSTGIVMVFGFMNETRQIYLDGRAHLDPDLATPTWNGDSDGHWEGNTLVIDTNNFIGRRHWMDQGIPVGENAHLVERITMPDPNTLQIDQTWTDPDHWVGEYKNKKVYARQIGTDLIENHCLPDTNDHIAAAPKFGGGVKTKIVAKVATKTAAKTVKKTTP